MSSHHRENTLTHNRVMDWVSLLLLAALLPLYSHSAAVNVGIVNGTEAQPHSRPYMVSLQVNKEHICGGFLVTPEFIMTAAHCWKEGHKMAAAIGAHDLTINDFARIPVKDHYIHPQFQNETPANDIMLLKLEKSVPNSKDVSCISIPGENENVNENTVCSVAGWGKKNNNGSRSNVLFEANVTIHARDTCKKHWHAPTILCAGGLKHGICQGDSGGPLVCNNISVGIASAIDKNNCDHPKKPNAYIDIVQFLPWIKSIIGNILVH